MRQNACADIVSQGATGETADNVRRQSQTKLRLETAGVIDVPYSDFFRECQRLEAQGIRVLAVEVLSGAYKLILKKPPLDVQLARIEAEITRFESFRDKWTCVDRLKWANLRDDRQEILEMIAAQTSTN